MVETSSHTLGSLEQREEAGRVRAQSENDWPPFRESNLNLNRHDNAVSLTTGPPLCRHCKHPPPLCTPRRFVAPARASSSPAARALLLHRSSPESSSKFQSRALAAFFSAAPFLVNFLFLAPSVSFSAFSSKLPTCTAAPPLLYTPDPLPLYTPSPPLLRALHRHARAKG